MKNIDIGVKYMLFASFLFALMAFFVKSLSPFMSSLEVVFFRNIFGVIIVLATFFKSPLNQKGGKPLLLLFRGLIGATALMMYFYNIFHMSLADAITFTKTSPIFTAVFAYIALKEDLKKSAWVAIAVGFIGMLFVIKPSGNIELKLVITGVLSGAMAGMAYTSIRELKNYYEPRVIVLSFTGVGTLVPALFLFLGEYFSSNMFDFFIAKFVMPNGIMWFYIVGMGLLATASQFLMTKAYSNTKAGIIGAVSYSNIFFAMVVGVAMGDALPDLLGTVGIVFIVFAGIWISKKR